jgi:hypothetical protein
VEDIKTWLESETSEHEYFWSGKVLRIMGILGYDYKDFLREGMSSDEKANMIVDRSGHPVWDAAGEVSRSATARLGLAKSRLYPA